MIRPDRCALCGEAKDSRIHRTGEESLLPGAHEFLPPKGWRSKLPSGFGVWLFLGAAVLVAAVLVAVLGQ